MKLSKVLIGRKEESAALREALSSPKAEMVAVIGRRRVGKTFLVDEVLGPRIVFQQTGVRYAKPERQLRTFANKLSLLTGQTEQPCSDWLDAFFRLRTALEPVLKDGKKRVLFFDELSWLATPEGDFLDYLAHFWNDWAHRQHLVLVLCGSVSSWIIDRVINDRGGLHNRVTHYLHLRPFTLSETAAFLRSRNINFTTRQIFQLYLALGGIPLYLEGLRPDLSLHENLDRLCFSPTGLLREEFNRLYPALFNDADLHVEVIRALAAAPRGLTRTQLIKQAALPNGGATSRVLLELEQTDFIQGVLPLGKKKSNKAYRLIDEYSLFYLRFIEPNKTSGPGSWLRVSQGQPYRVWAGLAFESVCLKHLPRLQAILGVAAVHVELRSFSHPATDNTAGVDADFLLVRADNVIHFCEAKFYRAPYRLTPAVADELEERVARFQEHAKVRSQAIPTLIVGGEFAGEELARSRGIRLVKGEELMGKF